MNRQSWKNQPSKDCLHTSALPWVTFGHISSVALKIDLNTDHVNVSSSLLKEYMFLWPGFRHCQDPYFVSWSHIFLPVYLASMLVGPHSLHKRGGVCLAYGNARANGWEYRDEFSLAFSFAVRKLQLHPSQKEYEHAFVLYLHWVLESSDLILKSQWYTQKESVRHYSGPSGSSESLMFIPWDISKGKKIPVPLVLQGNILCTSHLPETPNVLKCLMCLNVCIRSYPNVSLDCSGWSSQPKIIPSSDRVSQPVRISNCKESNHSSWTHSGEAL